MFENIPYSKDRDEAYHTLLRQIELLIEGEKDVIANLANASALLNFFLDDINWVGFYLYKEDELVLGPFHGLPACIRIPIGSGVCGTAAKTNTIQRIPNVFEFPGHIACDPTSKSELVIPMTVNGQLFGVLDIDSRSYERFDEKDEHYLQQFVQILTDHFA